MLQRLTATHTRRGMVLALTLWLTLLLAIIAYSLAYEIRLGIKMGSQSQKRLKAHAIARTGLAKAVVDLKNDRLATIPSAQGRNVDTLEDIWGQTWDKDQVEFGGGHYTVRVIDTDGKIDINRIDVPSMWVFVTLLEKVMDMDVEDAQAIAYAVIDYKDSDRDTCGPELDDEMYYYTEWGWDIYADQLPQDWEFRPKNEFFINFEELLQIPGITREMLYGAPGEVPADIFDRIDWDERSPALIDYLTVGSGRTNLNINTCAEPVLEAILGGAVLGQVDISDWASDIIEFREDSLKAEESEQYGIYNLNQLTEIGIPEDIIQAMNTTLPLGISSENFTIVSRGEYQGVRVTLQVEVQVAMEIYNINPDLEQSIGLRDPKASGYIEDQPNLKVDPSVRITRISDPVEVL